MKRNATIPRRLGWLVLLLAISVGAVAFSILVRTTPASAEKATAVAFPTVVATVPVGLFPFAVGVNPATNRVYVTNFLGAHFITPQSCR